MLGSDGVISMAVPSTGAYGIEPGIICSLPVRTSGGSYEIVEGLEVPAFSQERIDKTVAELREEREAVKRARLRDGALSYDLDGLRAQVEEAQP